MNEQVFRLSFGPKSFVVVSDAEVARYILMTNAGNYTKGVLSEILDFVMGKGEEHLLHAVEVSASPHIKSTNLAAWIDIHPTACMLEIMGQIVPKAAKTAPPLSSAKQAGLSLDAALLCSEHAELAQGSYQRMGMCGRSGGEP